MKPAELDKNFWNSRWEKGETGWDVGYATPAITTYFSKIKDKNLSILIPGCGNAYEAEYLLKHGFNAITILDIAPKAIEMLKEKFRNQPNIRIINENFFNHQEKYDLIVEQTFFCALSPSLRKDYVEKAAQLLHKNGKIVGVLFNIHFEKLGPPFGGDINEYEKLFQPYFEIETMSECYNSIPPRHGSEIFVELNLK